LAAYVPEKPISAPELVSVDSTQITLGLAQCGISNGDIVTHYVLYMQSGFSNQAEELGVYSIDSNEI
jgi:hypothetical protein